jgi:hypothetical protein
MSSGAIERDDNLFYKIEHRRIEKRQKQKSQKKRARKLGKVSDQQKVRKIRTRGLLSNRHEWLTTRDQCIAETAALPRSPGISCKSSERCVLLKMKRLSPSLPVGHQKGVSVVGSIFE